MGVEMDKKIRAQDIADFLKKDLNGDDCVIEGVCSLDIIKPQCLMFAEHSTPEVWAKISNLEKTMVICREDMGAGINGPRILSENPRLSFIIAVREFFLPAKEVEMHTTCVISPEATIGKNVSVGAFTVIDKGVSIDDNTVILNNVVISGRVVIGKNCFFKSNSVIGEDGFGFNIIEDGIPYAVPHFGGIIIGDNVWFGANSTIERGIFDDTVIENEVKVDDLVQIGHNARICKGSRIAAGAIICGAAKIEEESWIAPNSNILERKVIGKGSLVGLGSNILTDVPDNSVYVGNPGRKIRDNRI